MMVFAALFWGIWGLPWLGAQSLSGAAAFPGLNADPRAAEYARRGVSRPYAWQELAEIALWASGSEADRFMDRILLAAEEIKTSPSLPADPRERGEFILTYIHDKLLTSYAERQTRLDGIFSSGRYNCVSSAVLYLILAASQGLEAWGVSARDHAFVTLRAGEETIDVETTNPYGFDPGSRREFHDGFGRLTGFAYVPARNYRNRADISPLELISLIFTNRIFDLESRGRYGEAVPLALNRAVLLSRRSDPVSSPFFGDPNKELLDRLLNYGITLVKAGKEEDALRWAALAGERYPHERWEEFVYGALNNLLVKHIRSRRFAEGRSFLNTYDAALSRDNAVRLNAILTDAELVHRSSQIRTLQDAELSLRAINTAQNTRLLTAARAAEIRTFVFIKEGELLAAERGWHEALTFMENAVDQYGRNPQMDNAVRTFRSNRVGEIHNRFADLYNGQKYDDARQVVRDGLAELPGNRQLQTDLSRVEQTLRERR
jgi:hypothetical protein